VAVPSTDVSYWINRLSNVCDCPTDFICTSISIFACNKWDPYSLPDTEHRLSKTSWKRMEKSTHIAKLSRKFHVSIKPSALHLLPSVITIAEPDAHWHRGMCLLIRAASTIPPPRYGYHPPCLAPNPFGLTRLHPHSATTPTLGSACVERGTRAWYTLVLSTVFCSE